MIDYFDTNIIFFSMRLGEEPELREFYENLRQTLKENKIPFKFLDHTLDYWMRDYMPLQLNPDIFIHYYYYPDYLFKKAEDRGYITNPVKLEQALGLYEKDLRILPLILDGGNLIPTPGHLIMTDKIYKENRLDPELINQLIRKTTGLEPLIIKSNLKEEKYGHTDWVVRYIGGHPILLS